MTHITHYQQLKSYITQDGSHIREIMHPAIHASKKQSLAEATLPPGESTRLHKHRLSEELYFVTNGEGIMQLGNEQLNIKPGDCICIAPGTPHSLHNTGSDPLTILCCCSPAYSHEDTVLL